MNFATNNIARCPVWLSVFARWLVPLTMLVACLPAVSKAASAGERFNQQCRLPELGVLKDVGLGFPRLPFRLRTLGAVHIKVLFVDFDDVPATMSPQQVMAIISPRAEQYYAAVSYGKMGMTFDPEYHWMRMGKSSAAYGFHRGSSFATQRAYLQEAVDRSGTADYSATDAVLVLANPAVKAIDWGPAFSARPGDGIHAGGREIDNGATSGSDLTLLGAAWFMHEIGHTMSLVDLAGPLPVNQLWHTYVGDFSVMGNPEGRAPELLGWERWQLGWLADEQVLCATGGVTTARLSPIEMAGGQKMVVIPTGDSSAIVVESRRAEGYDRGIPKAGLLVYTVDTRLSSHDGAIQVYPVSPTDTRHLQSPMSIGQRMTLGDVSISFTSSDADTDGVTVTRAR